MIGLDYRTFAARMATLIVAIALLQGCAGSGDDGMGGTGIGPGDDGIGGTGLSAALDPEGIGGTGIVGEIAGADIAGAIAARGGMRVAGLEVALPRSVIVRRAGRRVGIEKLAGGQIVAVLADRDRGRLTAREIRLLDALVGEVTQIAGNRITVLGQRLRLDAARTRLAAPLSSVDELRVGQRVRVSGLWRPSGELEVTRVEAADARHADALFAPVSAVSNGRLYVGALEVQGPLPRVQSGDYVTVRGRADGLTLRAFAVHAATQLPFAGRVARVIVDGFPAQTTLPRVSIGAVSAAVAAESPLRAGIASAAREGRRLIAGAVVRGGAAEIRQLRPMVVERPVRDAVAAPIVEKPPAATADLPAPARPERPELPAARPVLPERPAVPELPARPPVPERPSPIDTRPVEVRPQATNIRPDINTPTRVLR